MQTIVIDGQPVEFTDEAAPVIREWLSRTNAEIADKIAENLQLSVRATALKDPNSPERREMAAVDEARAAELRQMDERISDKDRTIAHLKAQRAADERLVVDLSDAILTAKNICPGMEIKGSSVAEIHRTTLKCKTGRDYADKSDDFVAALFEMHATSVPPEQPRPRAPMRDALSDAITSGFPQPGQAPPGSSQGAYEEMCRDMRDAWKGKH
jgi:hypothetical protein